jgi:hypothetical protein
MHENKLKNINKIIDAEEYSTGGILDRAKEAAVSTTNEKVVQDIVIASRTRKRCRKNGRK